MSFWDFVGALWLAAIVVVAGAAALAEVRWRRMSPKEKLKYLTRHDRPAEYAVNPTEEEKKKMWEL